MAERRMFAKTVVNSARFLMMPQTSRLLYYDLGMAADDDGVVEAFTVIRTTGAAEDDLRVLAARGFIKVLNDDLVSYITDWRTSNKIRADRKTDSIYKDLLIQIMPETSLLQKKKRADVGKWTTNGQPTDNQWTTNGQPMDGTGKDSTGEYSIGKDINKADKQPKKQKKFIPPSVDEVEKYCKERKNNVDAVHFVDYYTACGWNIGRKGMQDWKAAVRTWEKNNFAVKTERKSVDYDYSFNEGESL